MSTGRLAVCLLPALATLLSSCGGDDAPSVDSQLLDVNEAKWLASPLTDYDLTLRVEKDRQAAERFVVSIRSGELVRETLDDRPVTRGMTGSPYSVPGLFETIRDELEGGDGARAEKAERQTLLRARFEERRGIPVIFKRLSTDSAKLSFVITVEELRTADGTILFREGQTALSGEGRAGADA